MCADDHQAATPHDDDLFSDAVKYLDKLVDHGPSNYDYGPQFDDDDVINDDHVEHDDL